MAYEFPDDPFRQKVIERFCEGNESDIKDRKTLYSRYQSESELALLLDHAKQIDGLPTGFKKREHKYCIGKPLIVSDNPIAEVVPLQRIELYAAPVLQWDRDGIAPHMFCHINIPDQEGMTTISRVVNQIRKTKGIEISPFRFPLDDVKTYDLFSQGNLIGVFAVPAAEGKYDSGIREFFQRVKPDNFRDIAATLALDRPGTREGGMLDHYIAVKHGKQEVEYLHPVMEEILSETYGIIIYQEQVMQILHCLGNIPHAEGYTCIKAIAKKRDLSRFRDRFLEGFQENTHTWETGEEVFDLIMKFAPYSFLKAHIVAYARIAYITAYLKTHYPDEFASVCLEY